MHYHVFRFPAKTMIGALFVVSIFSCPNSRLFSSKYCVLYLSSSDIFCFCNIFLSSSLLFYSLISFFSDIFFSIICYYLISSISNFYSTAFLICLHFAGLLVEVLLEFDPRQSCSNRFQDMN